LAQSIVRRADPLENKLRGVRDSLDKQRAGMPALIRYAYFGEPLTTDADKNVAATSGIVQRDLFNELRDALNALSKQINVYITGAAIRAAGGPIDKQEATIEALWRITPLLQRVVVDRAIYQNIATATQADKNLAIANLNAVTAEFNQFAKQIVTVPADKRSLFTRTFKPSLDEAIEATAPARSKLSADRGTAAGIAPDLQGLYDALQTFDAATADYAHK
jgi:hypothetical protein